MRNANNDLQDALNALDACMAELDHELAKANTAAAQRLLADLRQIAARIDRIRKNEQTP